MATKTTNYQFTKPEEDDFYNIEEANENWDLVDQELKKLEEEKANVSGGDISNTVIHALDSQEEEFPIPAAGDTVKGFAGKVKKFFEDFKAFKDGVITVGRLANNGLTTKEGFALDARYGKTLADGIDKLSNEFLYSEISKNGITVEANYATSVNMSSQLTIPAGYNIVSITPLLRGPGATVMQVSCDQLDDAGHFTIYSLTNSTQISLTVKYLFKRK